MQTDYQPEVLAGSLETIDPMYRTPDNRNIGCVAFRRYPDNSLDFDAAKNLVVDAIHKAKELVPLTNLEELILSVAFPDAFQFVDPTLASQLSRVNLRLSPMEIMTIRDLVSAHLKAEMNFNAGLGGGSVPGRAVTRT